MALLTDAQKKLLTMASWPGGCLHHQVSGIAASNAVRKGFITRKHSATGHNDIYGRRTYEWLYQITPLGKAALTNANNASMKVKHDTKRGLIKKVKVAYEILDVVEAWAKENPETANTALGADIVKLLGEKREATL